MRVFLIVLDGVGIGQAPDAKVYGDEGANSLANTEEAVGLNLPTMAQMGLGNIAPLGRLLPAEKPTAAFSKLEPYSPGKDTITGHWELAGLILPAPFPTYPEGFPKEIISAFEASIGRRTLGNYPASGTEIIAALGEEHLATGKPIIYTSADSVFQIAAHEEVIAPELLYDYCLQAREILTGSHQVARVIARPFLGRPGSFQRTERRRDFSLPPPGPTLLDAVADGGQEVLAVGKIEDIFAHRGITASYHTTNSEETMRQTIALAQEAWQGLLFANCIDTDMLWGHRNDPQGYAASLAMVDGMLPELMAKLEPHDYLVIASDHGCDPTTPSTDHSREYTPLLVWGAGIESGGLGIRAFSDLGATIAQSLKVRYQGEGESFWHKISRFGNLSPVPGMEHK